MEYGHGEHPSHWTRLAPPIQAKVVDGVLCRWDTRAIANGFYALRVLVFDHQGHSYEAKTMIQVANATLVPTATATPVPPTITSTPSPTLLPPTMTPLPTRVLPTLDAQRTKLPPLRITATPMPTAAVFSETEPDSGVLEEDTGRAE